MPQEKFDPVSQLTPPAEGGLSRRTVIQTAGALGLGAGVLAFLSACGVSSSTGSTAVAGAKGGTLTLGVDATAGVFDPAFYSSLGDWMVVDSVCRGLTKITFDSNEPKPDLATGWTISDDGLTYVFSLRKNVKMHDGTIFSSADVLRSYQRQFDPKDVTLPKGASRQIASVGLNVASMTATDANTFTMVLKNKDMRLPARLSDVGGRIISAAAIEKYGADIGKHLVGSGPFSFVSATAGQQAVLAAFPGYWAGRPKIDRLVMQQVQDQSTIISSLISGDISATQFTPFSSVAQLKANKAVTVYKTPDGADAILMMDTRKESLKELEVRQAINLAIDRKAILNKAFYGAGAVPKGYCIPPSQAGYDDSLAAISVQNVAKAKALLAKVGAVGRTVKLISASDSWHVTAAQIIAQNLTDIGLVVVSESVSPASYAGRLFNPADASHELMIWERNSYVPDPDNMIGSLASPTSVYGNFLSGWGTTYPADQAAFFATALATARNTKDGPDRTAQYTKIQQKFADEVMVVAMLGNFTNPVVSSSKVKGINVAALSAHRCFMEMATVN
ncbi:ABC transporter substrate-binding protein [Lacisediminihabitans profunda]|uniref:ABC transporter substrate-binding protein n=1 Tax=Lacisediminihabitans profunda TaxID=2594790 RepID=A0A5C8UPM3_9MICO|nr:ABC transporter substrate-binding protein [Lacisediminihabitans profunda]TXN30398.1 ABC transporter substrate-binding protein [Lacisediminihabitans profunda]